MNYQGVSSSLFRGTPITTMEEVDTMEEGIMVEDIMEEGDMETMDMEEVIIAIMSMVGMEGKNSLI